MRACERASELAFMRAYVYAHVSHYRNWLYFPLVCSSYVVLAWCRADVWMLSLVYTQRIQDIVGIFASFPPLSKQLIGPFIIVPDTTNASSILAAANTTGNNPTLDGTSLLPILSNPALSNDV